MEMVLPGHLDRESIQKIIPHRDPMLLVDEVLELVPGERAEAVFYVDGEREIFKGHFPGDAVFPGVYTVEAAAQTADILLLSTERYQEKVPLFLGIEHTTFKRKIVPGDTLRIRAKLLKERPEKGIATCAVEIFVLQEIAAMTEVTLAMR